MVLPTITTASKELTKKLLEEELRLRQKQPEHWAKTKYRKYAKPYTTEELEKLKELDKAREKSRRTRAKKTVKKPRATKKKPVKKAAAKKSGTQVKKTKTTKKKVVGKKNATKKPVKKKTKSRVFFQ